MPSARVGEESELRNGSFGTRSIIEDEGGRFWCSNTRYRYGIEDGAAADPGESLRWYKRETGIGDSGGYEQGEYGVFMSSVMGDDGAMWMAILSGVVLRYDAYRFNGESFERFRP